MKIHLKKKSYFTYLDVIKYFHEKKMLEEGVYKVRCGTFDCWCMVKLNENDEILEPGADYCIDYWIKSVRRSFDDIIASYNGKKNSNGGDYLLNVYTIDCGVCPDLTYKIAVYDPGCGCNSGLHKATSYIVSIQRRP